jgi:hypothetical protein
VIASQWILKRLKTNLDDLGSGLDVEALSQMSGSRVNEVKAAKVLDQISKITNKLKERLTLVLTKFKAAGGVIPKPPKVTKPEPEEVEEDETEKEEEAPRKKKKKKTSVGRIEKEALEAIDEHVKKVTSVLKKKKKKKKPVVEADDEDDD